LFNFRYHNYKSILSYLRKIEFNYKIIYTQYIMSLTGGKRKANKSLKSWVAFVKKVQREEKLSYKDAIHRAKIRKDKGEKWMTGGALSSSTSSMSSSSSSPTMGGGDMTSTETMETVPLTTEPEEVVLEGSVVGDQLAAAPYGGKRRRRTMRRSRGRGRGRGRTARRGKARASRRH
jgi:hypothetical protein